MIEFNKNLSKAEDKLLKYIIKEIKNGHSMIKLYENEILNIINPYDKDKVVSKFMSKFVDKRISYAYKNIKNENIQVYSPIINSLVIINRLYYLHINKKIIEIFFKKIEPLKHTNLDIYISLKNKFHCNFLNILLYQNLLNKDLEISLLSLKEKLKIQNMYNRFYDFEKKIILPFVNDVNENTPLNISYKTIKANKKENSKIVGIKFKLKKKK